MARGVTTGTLTGQSEAALTVKKGASQLLLERSGQSNLSETMWLRSEIAEVEAALGEG